MNDTIKCAFLVPFYGKLPGYFDYWAASCAPNAANFHWYVYNDIITETTKLNPAVTLIPYPFEQMKADFSEILDIQIPGRHLRRVCDYRLLFYFLRKAHEPLNDYDFIGYTDIDMIYGRLLQFMPENMAQFSVISANQDRPCGPFTLMNTSQMHYLQEWEGLKADMERVEHKSLNENVRLSNILSQELPIFCKINNLQPQITSAINTRHHYGLWDQGKVIIHDCWQRRIEGGFYHFSRFKDKERFKIDPIFEGVNSFAVYKFGITTQPQALAQKVKMQLSLYI